MTKRVTVIGAGLAGSEAAHAAATHGAEVTLVEMRPAKTTPAHTTAHFAELVCSNSFKSNAETSPAGLLKNEMRALGSVTLQSAEAAAVPGGEALAVDREVFAKGVTKALRANPSIQVVQQEADGAFAEAALAQGPVILATGPLTTEPLAEWLKARTGADRLFFFDAVSPTVTAESLDMDIVFAASRYDKGGDDYLNCPFDRPTYEAFVHELVTAERAPLHEFEADIRYFEGCMPIEAIAERGARSLAFGNFKPVGLTDPRTGRWPYAALQLRPENKEKTLYSLVACQTRLKWPEQRRVFRMVPGLQNADFVRLGVIHRNTYLQAPKVLDSTLQVRGCPGLYVAGQLTGVEGYMESAAMGILAGFHASGAMTQPPPRPTALGSLLAHLTDQTERDFAPMNINWGLLPTPDEATRDKGVRRQMQLASAKQAFADWISTN